MANFKKIITQRKRYLLHKFYIAVLFLGSFISQSMFLIKVHRRRLYYLVFALAFYMFWFLFKLGGMPDLKQAIPSTLIDVIFTLIPLIITVEFLLPKYIYRQKYFVFSIIFLLLVLCSGSVIIFSQLKLLGSSIFSYTKNIAKYQEHYFYWFWSDLIFGSYFLVIFFSLTGCFIRMAFDRIVEAKKIETLEKEKIMSELTMLKHQVNPHFIFNALNTVYYKIEKSNTDARTILQQFSSLLRYQLYESNTTTVPIEKEIEFLSNYIAVQRQRLDKNFNICCKGFKEVTGFYIYPYLLIPLVENCFKHTFSLQGENNDVLIECGIKNEYFFLHTENSITQQNVEIEKGIGLTNISKRLNILYAGKHSFEIDRNENRFKVKLQLKIS